MYKSKFMVNIIREYWIIKSFFVPFHFIRYVCIRLSCFALSPLSIKISCSIKLCNYSTNICLYLRIIWEIRGRIGSNRIKKVLSTRHWLFRARLIFGRCVMQTSHGNNEQQFDCFGSRSLLASRRLSISRRFAAFSLFIPFLRGFPNRDSCAVAFFFVFISQRLATF